MASRTYGGHGCRYCSGQATAPEDSLAEIFPEVAREFDVDLNKTTPRPHREVFEQTRVVGDARLILNHTWKKKVYDRTKKGSPCPKCREGKIGFLADRYPELAKEFDVEPKRNHPRPCAGK